MRWKRDGADQPLHGFPKWDYPPRVNLFSGFELARKVGLLGDGKGDSLPRKDPGGRLDHPGMSALCKCPGLNTHSEKGLDQRCMDCFVR